MIAPARALLLAALLGGCGGGAPSLGELLCQGGDRACQASTNPYQLLLAVDFRDEDGDLSAGVGRFYIEGDPQEPAIPLRPVFLASEVDLGATSGRLELTVNLDLPRPKDGTVFELGFEVEDSAGHLSNRPHVTFRIERP